MLFIEKAEYPVLSFLLYKVTGSGMYGIWKIFHINSGDRRTDDRKTNEKNEREKEGIS